MKGTYIKGTIEKVEGQGNRREREGTYTEDTYKKVQNKMNKIKRRVYTQIHCDIQLTKHKLM